MKTNALWGLIILILIIAGVGAWVLVGQPSYEPGTATTTPQENTEGNTNGGNSGTATTTEGTGPMTVDQLKARVVVDAPKSGATVPKKFTVTGKAPGPWYFEASFPVEVRSATGTVLATVPASALTDWMTTDDVAFKAEITITGYTGAATLVLKRDNPSGLPQNDASVSMPITIQ